jgi:hypothetical protein
MQDDEPVNGEDPMEHYYVYAPNVVIQQGAYTWKACCITMGFLQPK